MKVTRVIHDGLLRRCSCSPVGIHLGLEDAGGYRMKDAGGCRRMQEGEDAGCRGMQEGAGGCRRMQGNVGGRMQKDKGGCRRTQKNAGGHRRMQKDTGGNRRAALGTLQHSDPILPFLGQFWGCAAMHRRDLVVSPPCAPSFVSLGISDVEHPTVPRVCCCDVLLQCFCTIYVLVLL